MVRVCFTTLILLLIGFLPVPMAIGQTLVYEVLPQDGQPGSVPDPSLVDARPDDGTGSTKQGLQTFGDFNSAFTSAVPTLVPGLIDGRRVLRRSGGGEVGVRTNGPMNGHGNNTEVWGAIETYMLEASGVYRASVNIWVPDIADLGPVSEFVDSYPINGAVLEVPLEFNHTGFGIRTDSNGEMVLFAAVDYGDYSANPSAYEYTIPDRVPADEGAVRNNLHIIDMIVDTTTFDPEADFYVDGVAVDNLQNIVMNAPRVDQNIVRFGDCCGGASDLDWAIEWFKVEANVSEPHPVPPLPPAINEVQWVPDNYGKWLDNSNWTEAALPDEKREALLGGAISTPQTILVQAGATAVVKQLTFDSIHGYNIAGQGVLRTQADSGSAGIDVEKAATAGAHQLQVQLELGSDTDVAAMTGGLDFHNQIDLLGNALNVRGNVNINHSVVDSVGGGSVTGSGTLGTAGSTGFAGDLTFDGTLAIAIDSNNSDHFDVGGTADLAGTIEVDVADGHSPTGPITIITASNLIDGGLTLGGPDAELFNMNVDTTNNVIVLTMAGSVGVPGDYNNNGTVDAGDYTLWRDSLGTNTALANDSIGGVINEAHYLQWKQNFGSSGAASATAVPEPTSVWLMIAGLLVSLAAGRRN